MAKIGPRQTIKCKARRASGKECHNWAMAGQLVCKNHGGNTPQAKAKAQERIVMSLAQDAVKRLNIEPVGDPLTALSLVAGELTALKDFLRDKVEQMGDEIESTDSTAELRGAFTAYQTALRDVVATLATIARLKIDDRLVVVEQQKADMIAAAIVATLAELKLDWDMQQRAKVGVVKRLRIAASA